METDFGFNSNRTLLSRRQTSSFQISQKKNVVRETLQDLKGKFKNGISMRPMPSMTNSGAKE